jgi:hypothetical protein
MFRRTSHIVMVSATTALCGAGCVDTVPTDIDQAPDAPVQTADPPPSDRILVDASHDGGVWWFPQAQTFSASEEHQGKRLADYLRSLGFHVDELGRGEPVTDELLGSYVNVIRAGDWGDYSAEELDAYDRFLERETALILLSDHRNTDPEDQLAEMLGVTFGGAVEGEITEVAPHPITDGVVGVPYMVGAEVTAFDPTRVDILGWIGNRVPVMGIVQYGNAKIFFFGDTNTLETVPQPFVDNLMNWAFRAEEAP